MKLGSARPRADLLAGKRALLSRMQNESNKIYLAFVVTLAAIGANTSAGEKTKPFEHAAEEKTVALLTNQERKRKTSLPRGNPALSKIARAHSENMAPGQDRSFSTKRISTTASAGRLSSRPRRNVGNGPSRPRNDRKTGWTPKGIAPTSSTAITSGRRRRRHDKAGRIYITQISRIRKNGANTGSEYLIRACAVFTARI